MKRSPSASRRPLERGQITWVTAALLLGLVAGGYLAVVWVPVYLVHHEVRQVVHNYINKAVHERNDERLVRDLCQKLQTLDQREGEDARGRPAQVPVVDVEPREVTWERDLEARPPTLHVAFDYVRVVRYPILDRTVEKTMQIDMTGEIDVPKW
jgi:hypothetical protein